MYGADSEAQGEHWGTALHLAAAKGRANVLRLLLRHRAVVNSHSGSLGTPLHAACLLGDLPCATELINHGADAKAIAQIYIAHGLRRRDEWFFNYSQWSSGAMYECQPLFMAVCSRSLPLIRLLAADVHCQDVRARWWHVAGPGEQPFSPVFVYERTALMIAAAHGCTEVCCRLIEMGASINSTMEEGNTALTCVVYNGHMETCRELLSKGADANASVYDGKTALMIAADFGDEPFVRALLEHGVFLEASDDYERTAMLRAVRWIPEHHGHPGSA